MEEKDLQQEVTVVVEEETNDYDDLLKKFENPTEYAKPKKKHKALSVVISLVVVAALAGGITAMILNPPADEEDTVTTAKVTAETTADKVWQVSPATDDNGEIQQNGTGTLIEYQPAAIEKISVENESGSYTITSYTPTEVATDASGEETESTSTTEYTLVGFEDFELQSGNPDDLASDCSTVSFNKIISADATDNLADYGLDKPRGIATVNYTDGTTSVIRVGSDALQGLGTYIAFGDNNAVYIASSDDVDAILWDVTEYISLTINETADSASSLEYVTLSGTAYGEDITFEPSTDTDSVTNSYILTSPDEEFADETEATDITGAIRGLYATQVVCLNPTDDDLSKYGLDKDYAHLEAKYTDATINLFASQPDSDGISCVMEKDGNVIYAIEADSIPWVTTTLNDIKSDYILAVSLTGIDSVTVTADKKYSFKTTTTTEETTDDEGSTVQTTVTAVEYNGDTIEEGYFQTYFDNITLLTKCNKNQLTPSGDAELTLSYDYTGDRSFDVVKFYKSESNRHIVTINSVPVGQVYSSYVDKLIDQTADIASNKQVDSLY